MSNIDVVLGAAVTGDSEKVTPTFMLEDVSEDPTLSRGVVVLQASRNGDHSTVIDFALDVCTVNEDGTLHQMHDGTSLVDAWHQITDEALSLLATRDTHCRDRPIYAGNAYRLRYTGSGTDECRVIVATPFRPTIARSF